MRSSAVAISGLVRAKSAPILAIVLVNVLVGLVITPHYGVSWDEYGDFKYGEDSLQAYVAPDKLLSHGDRDYYGPFYLMVASVSSDILRHLRSGWVLTDGRHFSNFLTFQIGVTFFYLLARRYVSRFSALAVTLLFNFQPLLFGYGFVNEKDVPFMAFFTAAVVVGLIAVSHWNRGTASDGGTEARQSGVSDVGLWHSFVEDFRQAPGALKALLILELLLGALVAFDVAEGLVILPWIQSIVGDAYLGRAWEPINRAFRLMAQDAYKTPVSLYVEKARTTYMWLRLPIVLLAFAPAMVTSRRLVARTIDSLGRDWIRARLLLLAAGVTLGLCTSVRVAGPFAGALVSLAFLARWRRKATWPLLAYWAVGGLTTYATWPSLWANPLLRFWQAARLMTHFSAHPVLYNGQSLSARTLPWHYLPSLLSLQLTEPAVVLGVLGAGLSAMAFARRRETRMDLALLGIWIGVPAGAVILLRTPLYDNIRQMLFILPALFVLAGIGVEKVLGMLRGVGLKGIGVCLALLPGLAAIVALHPYETIYYNAIVGGVDGAVGRYEIDPWCTSYREAAEFVNRVAPSGASVAVLGPDNAGVATFAREDLVLINAADKDIIPDFAIGCMKGFVAPGFYPSLDTVTEIRRGKAVLAVVKQAR